VVLAWLCDGWLVVVPGCWCLFGESSVIDWQFIKFCQLVSVSLIVVK